MKRGGVKIETTLYSKFRGVDRASDPTDIDNSRSPYAPNLISGADGFPEKRPGWRVLATVEEPVNGIFWARLGEASSFLIHGGTRLYSWGGGDGVSPVQLMEGLTSGKSVGFVFQDKFYLLTGGEYIVWDGETAQDVFAVAYVPRVLIGRAPSGGGTTYEAVNLLQKKREVGFLPDGTSTVYQLPSTGIDSVDEVLIGEAEKAAGTDYTADLEKGTVTFTTAPKKPEDDGGVAGQDWVHITYSVTAEGYAQRITGCTIATTYGYGGPDRVILSGNPDHRNTDWTSGHQDPTYFPDLGYDQVGSSAAAIMGYARVGEYLAIIKEPDGQDNTVFFRSAALSEDEVIFPKRQAIVGIGMAAKNTVAVVDDEPLFLSPSGVYAITSNALTAERTVQNRSWYVDNVLREEDFSGAVAASWDNRYFLAVGGRAYLLDGNQDKTYKDRTNGDFVYECYQWENIPAVCLLSKDRDLYFGSADGKVCKFNLDIDNMTRYSDGGTLSGAVVEGGAAIVAQWATKADDDGDFMTRKVLLKQLSGVQIKPYTRSGVDVLFRTDADFGIFAIHADMDIFDWEDIDFSRFSFNSNDAPQVVPFRTKKKNYITLQIIVRNSAVNEGFGVLGIVKRFVRGKPVK